MNIPTLHSNAKKGDFARTVLMPGDPLRSRFIAETYLENARLVNDVRGIQGYTGEYKGKQVSVMASGMGMPTIGIYSYELYHAYGVEQIIRVGSAGMMDQSLKLRSVVAAMSAYSNSNYGSQFGFRGNMAPCADFDLLTAAKREADRLGIVMRMGPVYSSDIFYDQTEPSPVQVLGKLGVLAVEMEAYALFSTAAKYQKKALAILTVSDSLVSKEETTAIERERNFKQMVEIALNIA